MNEFDTLHFTLGPVQGFVAQARRTRDLWAGSFLLSYLTGHAMAAVLKAGGTILFPNVGIKDTKDEASDDLLAAILGHRQCKPVIGSLPNRFKARVPEDFDADCCREAIYEAWHNIAKAVWDKYFAAVAANQKSIWDEQVSNFWQISWVMGAETEDSDTWLDRRKNWRSYAPPPQAGDKCTLMGQWRELSGFTRANQGKKQKNFWQQVRAQKQVRTLDLGEHERLCAIALIKRFFPRMIEQSKDIIGWQLEEGEVSAWPSTSYFAATPWLCQIEEQIKDENDGNLEKLAQQYPEMLRKSLTTPLGHNQPLDCLEQDALRSFQRLDGQLYYQQSLENDNKHNYREDAAYSQQDLLEHLAKINSAVGNAPSPFYALLMMDGDRLGALLKRQKSPEDAQRVSQALADFTNQVDNIVAGCCGKTVYTGGDDVFALLPLDCALSAAQKLRNAYLEAFRKNFIKESEKGENISSISAGLCFAHYRTSLRAVREEAKYLLDKVAKEANGRDSIAISVLTSSGRNVEWCSSWQDSQDDSHNSQDDSHNSQDDSHICKVLTELVKDFSEDNIDTQQATTQEDSKQSNNNKDFASTFFYNVRQRFEVLTIHQDGTRENPQIFTDNAKQNLLEDLLVAEYNKSRATDNKRQDTSDEKIRERMQNLLKVCRIRKGDDSRAQMNSLNMQGALLVRFLATKGKGLEA